MKWRHCSHFESVTSNRKSDSVKYLKNIWDISSRSGLKPRSLRLFWKDHRNMNKNKSQTGSDMRSIPDLVTEIIVNRLIVAVAVIRSRAVGWWAMWRHVWWRHRQGGQKERQHLSTSRTRWRTESCLRLTVKLATHRIYTCHITSSAAATQLHHSRARYNHDFYQYCTVVHK